MAEKALYNQLETYNSKIPNHYRDNWGSILTFLDGKDTDKLMEKGSKIMEKKKKEQEAQLLSNIES